MSHQKSIPNTFGTCMELARIWVCDNPSHPCVTEAALKPRHLDPKRIRRVRAIYTEDKRLKLMDGSWRKKKTRATYTNTSNTRRQILGYQFELLRHYKPVWRYQIWTVSLSGTLSYQGYCCLDGLDMYCEKRRKGGKENGNRGHEQGKRKKKQAS